jgi:hypothetical protein
MTFADKLKALREKAAKGPWTVRISYEEERGVIDPVTYKSPGYYDNLGIYSEQSKSWPVSCDEYNVFDTPHDILLITYLVNHAEELEALVRAAEQVINCGNREDRVLLILALAALNKEKT